MTNEEAREYIKYTVPDVQGAPGAFTFVEFAYNAYSEAHTIFGQNLNPLFVHFRGQFFSQMTDLNRICDLIKGIYHTYQTDRTVLDHYIDLHRKYENDMTTAWNKYEAGEADIHTTLTELNTAAHEWWKISLVEEEKGGIIEQVIIPKFANKFNLSTTEAHDLVRTLAQSDELSIFMAERDLFYQIAGIYHDNPDLASAELRAKISEYLEKFFWFKSNFYRPVKITPEELIEAASKTTPAEVALEQQKIATILADAATAKEAWEQKISLSDDDRAELYFAKRVIEWLDVRKEGMMRHFFYFGLLMEVLAAKFNVTYDLMALFTLQEMLELSAETLTEEKIKAVETRNNGHLIIFKDTDRVEFQDTEANEIWNEIINKLKMSQDLKGMVASKGKTPTVTGRVEVILDPDKETFTPGSILVTTMTRVEFVPLMHQAKAIVTDEGGLACHAAVVSRELGVPCIIATKKATHTLKTGDEVELDMTTGKIVKI